MRFLRAIRVMNNRCSQVPPVQIGVGPLVVSGSGGGVIIIITPPGGRWQWGDDHVVPRGLGNDRDKRATPGTNVFILISSNP